MIVIKDYSQLIKNYTCSNKHKLKRFTENLLTELINKFDKLKPSAEYVKDFNSNTPYNQYNDDPDLLEVKSDLYDLFTSFIKTLKELPKVKEVSYHYSNKFGLSNYFVVYLDKPKDTKFLATDNIRDRYRMEFKISDHWQSGEVEFNIDLIGKNFFTISQEIERTVKDRISWLNQKEKNWNNKHKSKPRRY